MQECRHGVSPRWRADSCWGGAQHTRHDPYRVSACCTIKRCDAARRDYFPRAPTCPSTPRATSPSTLIPVHEKQYSRERTSGGATDAGSRPAVAAAVASRDQTRMASGPLVMRPDQVERHRRSASPAIVPASLPGLGDRSRPPLHGGLEYQVRLGGPRPSTVVARPQRARRRH